jgi:K+-dependent Na+/Ca+ exchanger-like protein
MLILYILSLLACFVFLARIVDLFFITSLDKISHDLKLSSDAAGATLMAAGSSAPELFVALFSVLKPGNHQVIGIGSIVGSALFNILVIVGVASLIKNSKLTWQPIIRDLIFYLIAVGLLLWGIFDGQFSIFEAALFIIVYIIYVVAVINWKKILPYTDKKYIAEGNEQCDEKKGILEIFDKLLCFIFPKVKHYYRIFFISILIIAGLSWVLVALTVIAIGTSVPDLFSSVIVAKQGRGDMAVSNAIGSNIFDILIGLGLPFFIVMAANGISIDTSGDNLLSSSMILFASVVLLFIMLIVSRWKLGKISGLILLSFYLFYIIREILIH